MNMHLGSLAAGSKFTQSLELAGRGIITFGTKYPVAMDHQTMHGRHGGSYSSTGDISFCSEVPNNFLIRKWI